MRTLLTLIFLCSATIVFAEKVDFNRDIRPILSENCLFCHGPDSNTREADLRLDQRDGALHAIKPGEPAESELIQRLVTDDEFTKMPPPDSNRSLSEREISLIKQWVVEGAEWGEHWSFTPLVAPQVPELASSDRAHNPIDHFVQAKLAEYQASGKATQSQVFVPSEEADRRTLIRRVTLDLTGLPPTPEEVDNFLNDTSSDAYEKVVDRLLASQAYGERMAWDWLDASRYADSNGYQGDMERTMWPWRDWVIDVFNQNMPYDQFTVWQLAGDLLPNATFEQKLATGFCRNHMINGEGGRIPEENRVDYVMDMSETTATLWLGLTFNCCRCHDHKYDPLSRKDYYSLFAFFNQTPVNGGGRSAQTPPILPAPTTQQQDSLDQFKEQLAEIDRKVAARKQELASSNDNWEQKKLDVLQAEAWSPLTIHSAQADHQTLTVQDSGAVFAHGENPVNDTYTVTASSALPKVTALRLDALQHSSHTEGGLARSDSGNFVLTEIEVRLKTVDESQPLVIKSAQATYEQGSLKITNAFDGNPQSGWAVLKSKPIDRSHSAFFVFEKPVEVPEGSEFEITLRHDSVHKHHNIGLFQLSVTNRAEPTLEETQHALLVALQTPAEKRTAEQKKLLLTEQSKDDPEIKKLQAQKEKIAKQRESLNGKVAKVMVMEDMPQPRETFMLERGLYNKPGEQVSAAVPESLPELAPEIPTNRYGLAQWLVSRENPLTPRVTVNRFWQQVFGIGLVKTAEDFGTQGEMPIHLDLLNWLAADFRDNGWNVKRLIKQMVMSHTYRQSSRVQAELHELDPENRLLARAPRYRLPSWMIRDQALAASGLLVNTVGGPSVNTYQPAGVWEEATFGKKSYKQDHGEALYRRSLYIFWRRIISPTMFFDNASRQQCTVKVFRTNTPVHALITFNDIAYVEAARALAERALKREGSDIERLDFVFERVLARPATSAEREILIGSLNESREQFRAEPSAAVELLSTGESPRDESLPEIEHAAWTTLCLAILNLDETLTKE